MFTHNMGVKREIYCALKYNVYFIGGCSKPHYS